MARKRKQDEYYVYNGGGVGYSQDALDALMKGQYDQLTGRDPQYRNAEDQIKQSRSLPVLKGIETPTSSVNNDWRSNFSTDRARRNYERRINHITPEVEAQNLRNRGYEGSFKNYDFSDYDKMLEEQHGFDFGIFGNPGAGELNKLGSLFPDIPNLEFYRDHPEAVTPEARQKVINKYGVPLEDVMPAYERYVEAFNQRYAEEHPYKTSLEDIMSAPDRALSSAVGELAHMAFPNSDLDQMLNSENIQGKKNAVQKKRDYVQKSNKLTDSQKEAAKILSSGGDFLTNAAVAGLAGGSHAVADVASGTGALYEAAPWVRPAVDAILGYGQSAGETRHELENQGVDTEKARQMGNVSGLIAGAAGALMTGNKVANTAGESFIKSILKAGSKAGGIGAGSQAANEMAQKIILDNQSAFDNSVNAYIAQGMSEKEAGQKAAVDILKRVGVSGGLGFIVGAGLNALTSGLPKLAQKSKAYDPYADLNSVWATQDALPMNDIPRLTGSAEATPNLPGGKLPALPDNIYPIQMPGTNGVINLPGATPPIQLPDLAARSLSKTAAIRANDGVIRSKPVLPSMIGKSSNTPTSTGASAPKLEIEDSDFAKGVANATPDNSFSRMAALFDQASKKNQAPTGTPSPTPSQSNLPVLVNPDSVTNPNRPYSLGVVHGKDGRNRYIVQQKTSDTGTKPVEPGKIYETEDEARQALLRTEKNASNETPTVVEPTPKPKVETPNNGYWLRVLGDDEYAVQEAERYGMTPEDYRGIAAKSLGMDIPPTNPNGGNVPPKEPKMKTSQTYTNTGANGGGWTEEEYAQYTDPSQFQYESVDEQESVNRAIDMRTREGREGFKNRMMKAQKASGAEIDGLMMEWRTLGAEARALEAMGQDASALRSEAIKVFRKVQELSTESAQGLQALAKWSRNTPEGMLSRAEHIANGKIRDGKVKVKDEDEKSAIRKTLDKVQKSKKEFKFSDEFVNDFLTRAEEILQLPADSRELKIELAKLGKEVNKQIPVSIGEKVTAILMNNMLGNFRTLISRNAGGNVGLNMAEQLIQRPLAAGIDSIVSRKTGVRTQSGLSKEGLLDYLKGFKQGISEEVDDFKKGLHTSRSGEVTLENAINANRHVFKTKFFDGMDNLVRTGLSLGDRPFYEAVYNQTLGDYHRLRDAGKMGEILQSLPDADFDEFAKAAAKMNALAAVYQKDTMLTKSLMGIKNAVGDLSRGIVGVDVLSQFSMPFVKTPAGVVDVAIDYSPIGLVRNGIKTASEIRNKEFDQNRFVNESSRNILGTLGMTAGAGAAAAGLMSKGFSEDTDEKNAQKAAGEQEYALKIGDNGELDVSWVPVLGSNAVASAATVDAYKKAKEKGDTSPFMAVAKGLEAGGESLLQQAVFQGMQKLFGGDSYNSDKGIVGNMIDTAISGVTQGVPSLVRQVAQTTDPYVRDLTNSNPNLSFGPWDNYDINSYISNVPVLRNMMLAPKVGTNGELVKANDGRNIASRAFENMVLPGKVTKVNYNALDQEASRLKELTTSSDAFMPLAQRKNVDTADHTLSNKEWTDFQQNYYGTMTEVGNKIVDSDYYKNADPTIQVKTLKNAYDAVKYALQSEYNGKSVDGAAKAYIDAGGGEKGVQAVVDYCTESAIKSEVEAKTGLSGQSKANESIRNEVKAGNTEKAEKMVDAATRLSQLGLTKPGPVEAYYNAQRNNYDVSPDEFAKTFKAIDADGNQGIKQTEVIDYLNNNSVPEVKGKEIYSIYAPAGKKKAKLKEGTWYLSK